MNVNRILAFHIIRDWAVNTANALKYTLWENTFLRISWGSTILPSQEFFSWKSASLSQSDQHLPVPTSSPVITWIKIMGEEDDERILITLPLGFITSTVIDPLWTAILSQAWKSGIRTLKVKYLREKVILGSNRYNTCGSSWRARQTQYLMTFPWQTYQNVWQTYHNNLSSDRP